MLDLRIRTSVPTTVRSMPGNQTRSRPSPTATPYGSAIGSTAQQLSDAEISAKSTKRAAWLAAGAALLTAVLSGVLSVGGVVWASNAAAKSASEAVEKQLFGETDKSRAEFLRAQRQELYAAIVEDDSAVRFARLDLLEEATVNRGADDSRKFAESLIVYQRAASKVRVVDNSSVAIIASPAVRSSFEKMTGGYGKIELELVRLNRLKSQNSASRQRYDSYVESFNAAKGEFLEACRVDMGNR